MKKKESKVVKIINWIIRIFWIFIIGSVFGFLAEMIYSTVYTRTVVIRQGLIYGPFVQIYGIGAVAYYILITKVKDPKNAFFFGYDDGRTFGIFMFLFSRDFIWNGFMGL